MPIKRCIGSGVVVADNELDSDDLLEVKVLHLALSQGSFCEATMFDLTPQANS